MRNERPRSGQEVLVLRHQQLRKGAHDAYRLARYASFDHWRATRDPVNVGIGGNGGDREKSLESGRDRVGVQTGSKGAYFLQGENAPTPATSDEIIAVRHGAVKPGQEIVELRYQRITKGTFDRFVALTRDAVWPWDEKPGARPIGQWKVIHPGAPSLPPRRRR